MTPDTDWLHDERKLMEHDLYNMLSLILTYSDDQLYADRNPKESRTSMIALLAKKALARIDRARLLGGNFAVGYGVGLYKVSEGYLLQIIRELVREYSLLEDIAFRVEDKEITTLSALCKSRIELTRAEQAIRNVIDNARWYSYPRTTVVITASVTADYLFIEVRNKGIPILPHEIPLCTQRGWRGEKAKAVRSGGTGTGLWSADNVMRTHKGVLRIESDEANDTVVALGFPLREQNIRTE